MAPNGSSVDAHTLSPQPAVSPSIKASAAVSPAATAAPTTLNLKAEADRIKTFDSWPVPFMDRHRLAAAGFYYLQRDDVVCCAFCKIEIGSWEEGDDPFRDHQRWSPACPYIRRLPVGNIPLDPTCPAVVPTDNPSEVFDTCGPFGIQIQPNAVPESGSTSSEDQAAAATLADLGINKSRGPVCSKYATLEARLKSYESWPLSIKQRPDKLSEAGFYYTGKGDQTVCFHCGGGLKDWEESDEPWIEHALWFSKCTYLLLIKGKEFVDKVCHDKAAHVANMCAEKDARVIAKEAKAIQVPSDLKGALQIRDPSTSSSMADPPTVRHDEKVIDDVRLCKICYQEEVGVVFLPCGHLVACVKCAPSLSTCAVCRKPFSATVRAFLS